MLTILTTRTDAKTKAATIHEWRGKNILNYNATSWANENLSDAEYDKLYKSQADVLWELPLAHDDKGLTVAKALQVSALPVGWVSTVVADPIKELTQQVITGKGL